MAPTATISNSGPVTAGNAATVSLTPRLWPAGTRSSTVRADGGGAIRLRGGDDGHFGPVHDDHLGVVVGPDHRPERVVFGLLHLCDGHTPGADHRRSRRRLLRAFTTSGKWTPYANQGYDNRIQYAAANLSGSVAAKATAT